MMRANNVHPPTLMTNHEEFENDGDEKIETFEVSQKDWFKPAAASMAKLNHVHASMYNMAFKNAGSLRPPQSIQNRAYLSSYLEKRPPEIKQKHTNDPETNGTLVSSKNYLIQDSSDIHSTSSQPVPSFRKRGSSASIIELATRQRKLKQIRPSSAKVPNQSHPWSDSIVRAGRPSVTDSLGAGEPCVTEFMAVRGEKKSFDEKPYLHYPLLSSLGYRVDTAGGTPDQTEDPVAMVSYPVYMTSEKSSNNRFSVHIPYSSPVSSDEEDKNPNVISPHLERPCPINLSLPSDDANDDNNDEVYPDMQRLLPQSDESVQKKRKEDSFAFKTQNMPKYEISEPSETVNLSSGLQGISFDRQTLKAKSNKTDLRGSGNNKFLQKNRYPFTKSTSQNMSSDYSLLKENYFDSHAAGDHIPTPSEKTKITTSLDLTELQEDGSISHLTKFDDENTRQHEVFQDMSGKTRSKVSLRGSVKIREDKNVTVNITPRNMGRKIMARSMHSDQKTCNRVHTKLENNSEYKTVVNEADLTGTIADKVFIGHTPLASDIVCNCVNRKCFSDAKCINSSIPVVTVTYGEDDEEQMILNNEARSDVDSIISQLSELNTDLNSGTLQKSIREKNYYEMARLYMPLRPKSAWNVVKEPSDLLQEKNYNSDASSVLKTTKTIEFHPHIPKESVSKSAITAMNQKMIKDDRIQPRSLAQRPGIIKKGQESSMEERKIQGSEDDTVSVKEEKMSLKGMDASKTTSKNMSSKNAVKKLPPSGKTQETHRTKEKLFKAVQSSTKKRSIRSESTKNLPGNEHNVNNKPSSSPKMRSQSDKNSTSGARNVSKLKHEVQTASKVEDSKCKPLPSVSRRRKIKSANSALRSEVSNITPIKAEYEAEMLEVEECQDMQAKMAALGVDIGVRALEKAIFTSNGKSHFSHRSGYLPSDPSSGLIPHYKHWLPEEYNKLEMIKRRLAEDDRLKHRQKLRIARRIKLLQERDKLEMRTINGINNRRHSYG